MNTEVPLKCHEIGNFKPSWFFSLLLLFCLYLLLFFLIRVGDFVSYLKFKQGLHSLRYDLSVKNPVSCGLLFILEGIREETKLGLNCLPFLVSVLAEYKTTLVMYLATKCKCQFKKQSNCDLFWFTQSLYVRRLFSFLQE